VDPPVEDLGHDRAAFGVGDQPGPGPALGGFDPGGVRVPLGQVPVGDGADVPPVQGVLDQPVPAVVQHLQTEELAIALLDPADQDRGRAGRFDADRLIGSEDRYAALGEFFFHGQ
jgi:hypothetical protein